MGKIHYSCYSKGHTFKDFCSAGNYSNGIYYCLLDLVVSFISRHEGLISIEVKV